MNTKLQNAQKVLGCDFFRPIHTQIHRYTNRGAKLFFVRDCSFVYLFGPVAPKRCFFRDYVVAQLRRYADTQISVPAFLPLMHASSLK